jgi:hypothetical protein
LLIALLRFGYVRFALLLLRTGSLRVYWFVQLCVAVRSLVWFAVTLRFIVTVARLITLFSIVTDVLRCYRFLLVPVAVVVVWVVIYW